MRDVPPEERSVFLPEGAVEYRFEAFQDYDAPASVPVFYWPHESALQHTVTREEKSWELELPQAYLDELLAADNATGGGDYPAAADACSACAAERSNSRLGRIGVWRFSSSVRRRIAACNQRFDQAPAYRTERQQKLMKKQLTKKHAVMVLACVLSLLCLSTAFAAEKPVEQTGELILEDDFNRDEAAPDKEQIGNGWTSNSAWRAKGHKQVDLADGAMHVTRHDEADHGVAIFHNVAFQDGAVELKFKLRKGDDLGLDFVDRKLKTVHAGHLCMGASR